jgi:hypothetical protein
LSQSLGSDVEQVVNVELLEGELMEEIRVEAMLLGVNFLEAVPIQVNLVEAKQATGPG